MHPIPAVRGILPQHGKEPLGGSQDPHITEGHSKLPGAPQTTEQKAKIAL